jgi:transcriptional regulator with XRE-family HTH domain
MTDIRAFRKAHGLTQAEVASRLKISQAMVADLEAGTRKPSPELSAAISRLLASGGEARGSSPRGPYFGRG